MKRNSILGFFLVTLALTLLAACGISQGSTTTTTTTSSTTNSSSSSSSTTNYTVTMGATSFNTASITIPKGSTITFVTEQGGTAHNLINGSSGQLHDESGAATFAAGGHVVGPGSSWTTTPWNTAGTFHVTCTYHPTTMTLTVIVTG